MTPIGAMILAAGRGERMRPLSDTTPKPLLEAGGKPLIVWQIEALARAGFRDIVVNAAHLAGTVRRRAGRRRRARRALRWSFEPEPLEVAGGIATALPLLPPGPALIVAGDVYTAFDYASFRRRARGDGARRIRRARPSRAGPESALSPERGFRARRRTGRARRRHRGTRTRASASTIRPCSANFRAGRRSNCFRTSNGG